MTVLIVVAALTVLVSGICSLMESTLYSTNIWSLEAEKSDGRKGRLAKRLIAMKARISRPTSAILVLNTVANTAGATLCGMYATSVLGERWVPAVSAGLVIAILFLGEIIPKTFGATHWRVFWHWIVWPLVLLQKGLSPFVWITEKFSRRFAPTESLPEVTEDEIQASIQLGSESGELTPSEVKLLQAVFRFDDMVAKHVMVPRIEVVFLDTTWSMEKALEVAKHSQHTRFPLCEGSLDAVVGLVHIKDMLGLSPESDVDLRSVSRTVRHIPGTQPISRLLRDMQETHEHMALVHDEHGSLVGIVTMENVVEQIVGQVQDEFDSEPPEIEDGGDRGVYKVIGHIPIDRLNRKLGLDLSSPNVDTLSGLLVSRLDRLLRVGDRVQVRGATAEVIEEQGGRATKVRLSVGKEL